MKRIRKLLIFCYIFLTVLVVIINPVMHKPVALETTGFKIKEQLLNPKPRLVSDYTVKLKFTRANPVVAKSDDRRIHINPDEDDRRLAIGMHDDQVRTTDISFGNHDNVRSGGNVDLDVSGVDAKYRDGHFGFHEQDGTYREQQIGFGDNTRHGSRDTGLGGQQIPKSEFDIGFADQGLGRGVIELEDSDEVGNAKFKGSREEVVAWNVWRSNLQNRIMDETAIEAPVGTLILFSFNVSKSGRISNFKYSCSDKKYAESSKADMKDILKRLQGDEVLRFPENTKRSNVRFKGGFLLDYETQYSRPSDYSDYERVRE